MIEQYLDQRAKLDRQVVERAMTDGDFRTRLVADTRGTLNAEYGVSIPAEADVRAIEESAGSHIFVLPAAQIQNGELSEEALEAVAGGWYVNLIWSSICFGSGEGGPSNADISVSAT